MGIFPCREKLLVVTMVWVVSRFRFKAPPCISSSYISPLTSSGQRSRASWASQPQKSATLSPQPGGKPRTFIRTCGGIGKKKKKIGCLYAYHVLLYSAALRPFSMTIPIILGQITECSLIYLFDFQRVSWSPSLRNDRDPCSSVWR